MGELEALAAGIKTGQYRALAKAISLVERDDPNSERLLAEIYPLTGKARILGITGSPGSGKSTLVRWLLAPLLGQELAQQLVVLLFAGLSIGAAHFVLQRR